MKVNKNNLLIILDGFGLSDNKKSSAYLNANAPTLNKILDEKNKNFKHAKLTAHGELVGLPKNQMGNSEVGHLNIGSGQIVMQDILRIDNDIKNKTFAKNKNLLTFIKEGMKTTKDFHLIGLVSDGGVHSSMKHLFSILETLKQNKVKNVYIHAILDGRDTLPTSAKKYLNDLEKEINKLGFGEIVTIAGRYYALDRDKNWDRVKLYYDAITNPKCKDNIKKGEQIFKNYKDAFFDAYGKGETDEFVIPRKIKSKVIIKSENNIKKKVAEQDNMFPYIKNGDSILFFNFRADRARELTRSFLEKDFKGFKRNVSLKKLNFATLTNYDDTFDKFKIKVIYDKKNIKNTLGEYISGLGLKQLRIAETEKYAHVTFFFNGGVEKKNKNEDRILIPSPKVKTYDLKPSMSANEITETLIKNIKKNKYDLIIVNFANPDMVGHTGDFKAGVKAVEAVDKCLKKVLDCFDKNILENKKNNKERKIYNIILTADHGNIEDMKTNTGLKITSHSINKVPFVLINNDKNLNIRKTGKLSDIAPTLLSLMSLKIPSEMTGESLLKMSKDRLSKKGE